MFFFFLIGLVCSGGRRRLSGCKFLLQLGCLNDKDKVAEYQLTTLRSIEYQPFVVPASRSGRRPRFLLPAVVPLLAPAVVPASRSGRRPRFLFPAVVPSSCSGRRPRFPLRPSSPLPAPAVVPGSRSVHCPFSCYFWLGLPFQAPSLPTKIGMPEKELTKGKWKKGGGGFGPVTRGSKKLGIPNPKENVGQPGGWRVGDRARLEVVKYQRDGGYLIPKVAFLRLVREVFEEATKKSRVARMESSAVEALQLSTEAEMALLFNSKFLLF